MSVEQYHSIVRSSVVHVGKYSCESRILNDRVRAHQAHAIDFALEQGRSALFLDTGLGKSLCAFNYADNVIRDTNKPTLMLAPLGVIAQHKVEADKFGYEAQICKTPEDIKSGLNLTNYERIHLFDPSKFGGVILDESSCIKNYSGIMTRRIFGFAENIHYRLACTATPAPNDHMELGQHSQFLGVMSSSEMLSRWFLADQSEMGRYRLKRHAVKSFWQWMASWSRCAEFPSDIGGCDDGYILPPLNVQRHLVKTDIQIGAGETNGQINLFRIPSNSATSIHSEKRLTADDRANCLANLVTSEPNESWIVWCETDYDAQAFMKLVPHAHEVHGSMTPEQKADGIARFVDGTARILVTKPKIAGMGLNFQHCARAGFMGLSFSYEAYYQAVRRLWRFGQERPVDVHIASAETEESIWQAIVRKREQHDEMKLNMRSAMKNAVEHRSVKNDYLPQVKTQFPKWLESA